MSNNHTLSLNTNKTNFMTFGTNQRLSLAFLSNLMPIYRMSGAWSLWQLKAPGTIRQNVSVDLALQLCKSLILKHFDYGYIVYDTKSTSNASQPQVLQNNCLRICLNRKPQTWVIELHDARLPLLHDWRKQHVCQAIHKGSNQASIPYQHV